LPGIKLGYIKTGGNSMRKSKVSLIACLVAASVLISAAAWATPAFLTTFNTTYKPKAGTALAKASCAICHVSATKTDKFNPYGQDLKKNATGGKVTKDTLAKVEKLDSDKDKATNIVEIKAGTLPGDPKSTPKAAAPKKPAPPKKVAPKK
jgi:hypothetical protein